MANNTSLRTTDKKDLELWYLEDDDRDYGHLRAEPREETLQLTTLTNQVAIYYDGNQSHGFHGSLEWRGKASGLNMGAPYITFS